MTSRVKKIGCSVLKDFIESGKLWVSDRDTIKEFRGFEKKGDSYGGPRGGSDDLVMSLVLFAYFTTQAQFNNFSDVNVRSIIFDREAVEEMESEELPAFGLVENSRSLEESENDDGSRTYVKTLEDDRKVYKDSDFGWAIVEDETLWTL